MSTRWRHWLMGGVIASLVVAAATLLWGTMPPVPPGPVLGEAATTCFGYTVHLALEQTTPAMRVEPGAVVVPGVRYRATVTIPATARGEVTVELEGRRHLIPIRRPLAAFDRQ